MGKRIGRGPRHIDSIHLALSALITEIIRSGEAGWPTESILYRVMTEGHVARADKPGHKILSKDLSRDARWVKPAFESLPLTDKIVVITKHRPKPDGYDQWRDKEMADYIGEPSKGAFVSKYHRILKKLKNRLT